MRIEDFGSVYSHTAVTARILPRPGSYAAQAGEEILAMARAYAEDGSTFLTKGDVINAAAAFAYGLGWLDAGEMLGYIGFSPVPLPQLVEENGIRQDLLAEKTARYHTLLECALKALVVAPETGTIFAKAADVVLVLANDALSRGTIKEERGTLLPALLEYSYGFGWLDTGVRAGLFRIRERREIFTV
ncbi:MAG: DUF357 domain-containing protein [Methanomicrobiales archaeon]|nr:DUF357 domain-containing protein [Methanomicrobiales archaeon]